MVDQRAELVVSIGVGAGGTPLSALVKAGDRAASSTSSGACISPPRRHERSDLWRGPERPAPAPPRRRRHGDDQLATLQRAQRDVQRPRRELELGRELRGRDGAWLAGRDHIERRLLARGEVISGVAGQRGPYAPPEERDAEASALDPRSPAMRQPLVVRRGSPAQYLVRLRRLRARLHELLGLFLMP
jgi:hypothetical protein